MHKLMAGDAREHLGQVGVVEHRDPARDEVVKESGKELSQDLGASPQ
jgi:hypothetical protein